MAQQTRAWGMLGIAATIWVFGLIVLGTQWEGTEAAPGVWEDGVSLQRWGLFWVGLFVGGALVAPWLPRWRHRGLALVPLLTWVAVELRHGSLAPIAWCMYAAPTAGIWLAGTWLGDRTGGPLARGVKRSGA